MANQANRFQKQVNPDFIFLYPPTLSIVYPLAQIRSSWKAKELHQHQHEQ